MKKVFPAILATLISSLVFCQTKISIDSVANHYGNMVTVCSKVYGTRLIALSQTTLISLGAVDPNSLLTVVIFSRDRSNFKEAPETVYADKNICVTGTITKNNGKPEIIVSKPGDIIIQ
jgi:hypothetical protein